MIASAAWRSATHAAADSNGKQIVSTRPARLFSRNQAITALTLAERLPSATATMTRTWWRGARNFSYE
jgi:hypothetical protein